MLKYRSFYEIDNPDKRLLKILGRGRGAFESLGSFYISCYGKFERVGGGRRGGGKGGLNCGQNKSRSKYKNKLYNCASLF